MVATVCRELWLFPTQPHTPESRHYSDDIKVAMASQITDVSIVHLIIRSGADQRKHQSSALVAFVRGIHRVSVNSPHKGPVTRKILLFDDVIILSDFRNTTCSITKWWTLDWLLYIVHGHKFLRVLFEIPLLILYFYPCHMMSPIDTLRYCHISL